MDFLCLGKDIPVNAAARPSQDELLLFANELADVSSEVIKPHFREKLSVDNKADEGSYDPVTVADRAAEQVIREALAKHWPDHGIVGEEYDDVIGTGQYSWVIDPIDGTRSFIMGYPTWGTLIGLCEGDKTIIGLMNQPYTGERFWGTDGGSFWRKGSGQVQRLKTRDCASMENAIMATTDPLMFAAGPELTGFEAVKQKVAMTRYGGDCYAYCMLASGLVDIVVEASLKPHDVIALIPIVKGAGGQMTTWDGGPAEEGGCIVASGDRRIHQQALKLLAHR